MSLFEKLKAKAQSDRQRIVLAESTEVRTLKAADEVIGEGIADIILLGDKSEIVKQATEMGLNNIGKATFYNPQDAEVLEPLAQLFYELRKNKGVTIEDARKTAANPLYFGCLLIKSGQADGQVAGALNSTGNVLRAAFQVLKTAPGVSVVSGAFIMQLPEGSQYGAEGGLMVFADCAVVPNPSAAELAQIAISTSYTARDIAGIENPIIAMLSFSTKGSAKGEMIDKVVEATKIVKDTMPDLLVDGELQADAALVSSVGQTKAPGSPVAGKANVLVFPNLETGNIAYKLVQRLAGATAVGPILQGIAAPVNDLSRGCSPKDIVKTIIITCNQALDKKNR